MNRREEQEQQLLREGHFTGERALYHARGLTVEDSYFSDGESPLKEGRDITVRNSIFAWKYPLWYCDRVDVEGCTLLTTARSGIWYTDHITMRHCQIDAPKTFRRGRHLTLENCVLPHAEETLWNCQDVHLTHVSAAGDYFAMGCAGLVAEDLTLSGNYAFDGARDIEIRGARMTSKDSFWNAENVVVRDSVIVGEYLGWNSRNVTFINCTIESNQGFCYMDGLRMENCRLIHTDLAFEFSKVEADIRSHIVSVKNPISGTIRAESIGQTILQPELVDPAKTRILTAGGDGEQA